MKIGIFGGTFNPIHLEHVNIAKNAIKELKLDKLLVLPTFISPHKNTMPAPAEDRLNMVRLAFKNCNNVEVSDFEIKQGGKSYTYLTVEHFKKLYNADLYLIVGGDMLKDFKNWKYPERILQASTLAVFNREDWEGDFNKEEEYFKKNFDKTFIKLKYRPKPLSSTEIRIYSELNINVDNLTDNKVAEYIKNNHLYSGDEYSEFIKNTLPEKRLIHTANVTICALKKAHELNLDYNKVKISALLHDCAKYIDYKSVKGFTLPKDVPEPVIHAFLGSYIAQNVLNIQDEEILDAIKYHTSGKANMTTLGKLIFVADMVEKGRTYEGVETLRKIFIEKDIDTAFNECLKEEFVHLINRGGQIYFETLNAFDYYIKNKR